MSEDTGLDDTFTPDQWIKLGGSTSNRRRYVLRDMVIANHELRVEDLITRLVKGNLNPLRAAELTRQMWMAEGEWQGDREPRARSSASQELALIKQFYNAFEIPYKKDLWKSRVGKIHMQVEQHAGEHALNWENCKRFLLSLKDEPGWQALVHFMLDTGCRKGEAIGTRWKDLLGSYAEGCPERVEFLHTKNGEARKSFISSETSRLLGRVKGVGNRGLDKPVFDFTTYNSFYHGLNLRLRRAGLTKQVQVGEEEQLTRWEVYPHVLRATHEGLVMSTDYNERWKEYLMGHMDATLRAYFPWEEAGKKWMRLVDPRLRFLS